MCPFCDIAIDIIPCEKVYEDNLMCVFKDINPKADIHLLAIPKIHIENLKDIHTPENIKIITHMITQIPLITLELGIGDFKLITNTGKEAGQEVSHLHFHILSGNIQL